MLLRVLTIFILCMCVHAQLTWITDASSPVGVAWPSGAVYHKDGYIYRVFGYSGSSINAVHRYSPTSNNWITLATTNTPTARRAGVVAAYGDYIYHFGGTDDSYFFNEMYRLHIPTLAWERVYYNGATPTARAHMRSASSGTHWYMWGGQGSSSIKYNDLYEYSFATDSFTLLPANGTVPPVGYLANVQLYGNEVITFASDGAGSASMYWYNLITHAWSYKGTTPTSMVAAHSALIGNYIYVFGGYSSNSYFRRLNLTTETWETVTAAGTTPTARYAGAFCNMNGTLWISGGYSGSSVLTATSHIVLAADSCAAYTPPVGIVVQNCTGNRENDTCTLSCETGYIGTPAPVTCMGDYIWSPTGACDRACTASDVVTTYTACPAGYKNATYTFKSGCVQGDYELPNNTVDIPCNVSCGPGQYLPYGSVACAACQAGTYSLGSAAYDVTDWSNVFNEGFYTYCTGTNCKAWNSTSPSFITSGDNANVHGISSVLARNITLSANGSVRFTYRVESESCCDMLRFAINGTNYVTSASSSNNTFTYNLTAGTYRLTWTYSKDGSVSSLTDRVYLYNVTFTGAEQNPSQCLPCPSHTWSSTGASSCTAYCGDFVPQTGYIEGSCTGSYLGDTCTFTCDNANGFIGDSGVVSCNSSGYWSTSTNCNRRCPAYVPPTGYTTLSDCSSVSVGSYCPVICDEGYSGPIVVPVCCDNQTWSMVSGCHVGCDAGQYYNGIGCSSCAAGTYSTGNSTRTVTDWTNFLSTGFITYCTGSGCKPWSLYTMAEVSSGDNYYVHSVTSNLALNMSLAAAGSVGFSYKVVSDTSDYFTFYVDDIQRLHVSYVTTYTTFTYNLTAGIHRLVWTYAKNSYTSYSSDRIYLNWVNISSADSTVTQCLPCPGRSWSSTGASSCTAYCGDFVPQTGYIEGSCTGSYLGDTCTFTCDNANNYYGNSGVVSCNSSGYWSTSTNCNRRCPAYVPPTGYRTLSDCSSLPYNSYCYLTCDAGYSGSASSVYCSSYGTWTSYVYGCSANNNNDNINDGTGTVVDDVDNSSTYTGGALGLCIIGAIVFVVIRNNNRSKIRPNAPAVPPTQMQQITQPQPVFAEQPRPPIMQQPAQYGQPQQPPVYAEYNRYAQPGQNMYAPSAPPAALMRMDSLPSYETVARQ